MMIFMSHLDSVQTCLTSRVLSAFNEGVLAAHDNSGGAERLTHLQTFKRYTVS